MGKDLIKVRRRFKESNVLFQSENSEAIEAAIRAFEHNRTELEKYIITHSSFLHSLRPVRVEADAPRVVKIMAESTHPLNIGPMAAVAGALADLAVESMLDLGVEVAVVEDGGEVSAVSKRVFIVGLYTGRTGLSGRVGFRIEPSECPIGIGTSSATVSHAFSFGEADAATIFADTAALADAAATAVCNTVQGNDVEASVQKGLKFAEKIYSIRGALIVRGKYTGVVGRIPKFARLDGDLRPEEFLGDAASSDVVFL